MAGPCGHLGSSALPCFPGIKHTHRCLHWRTASLKRPHSAWGAPGPAASRTAPGSSPGPMQTPRPLRASPRVSPRVSPRCPPASGADPNPCWACQNARRAIENKTTIKKQPAIVGRLGLVPRSCQGSFAMHLTMLIVIGALYAIFFPMFFCYADFFCTFATSVKRQKKKKQPKTKNQKTTTHKKAPKKLQSKK